MESKKLSERSSEEMPYERCMRFGPEALTDTELLAVMLRTGTQGVDVMEVSDAILTSTYMYEGIGSILHLSYEDLMNVKGIGRIKAIQIMCLSEFCKRLWKSEALGETKVLNSPSACSKYYQLELKYLEREVLKVAFLDLKKRIICDTTLTKGTINSSLVSVREILVEALRHRAVSIILVHNHPTGDPYPSNCDIEVTDNVKRGCEAVGIKLEDHIIIGQNKYFSFRERDFLK